MNSIKMKAEAKYADGEYRNYKDCIEDVCAMYESRTCEGCKYVNPISDDSSCDNEIMGSYYGMTFNITTFSCNEWAEKDSK